MKWKLRKIEIITLSDTEIKCTNSAQEKETQNIHTQTKKTNQPTKQLKKKPPPVVSPKSRVDLTFIFCKDYAIWGILRVWYAW